MAAGRKGEFARSKAGHDKNEIFIIYNIEEEYVFLVDGKSRTTDRPKKKKWKHIQVINETDDELQTKIEAGKEMLNEDIKRAIKKYRNRTEAKEQV